MPDPITTVKTLSEFSALGVAAFALFFGYFVVKLLYGQRKIRMNDLLHIEQTLNEVRDILREGKNMKEDMNKKITYLYEEALKRR